ncbi:unnamed protein product [Caenorhabditis brenneri]
MIADLLSLTFYLIFKISTTLFSTYFFSQEDIPFAQIFYSGVYWSIIFRAHGIALLTIHRYLVIVRSSSSMTNYLQREKPWIIWLRFWIPPLVFNGFLLRETKVRFFLDRILIFAMDTEIVHFYSNVIILFLTVSCAICIISYILMIVFVRTHAQFVTQSLRREYSLALQMFLPFLGMLGLLVYMVFINIYAVNDNSEGIQWVRGFFALVNGTNSFIGPFTIILFNKDLTKKTRDMTFGKLRRSSVEPSVAQLK